MIDLAAESRDGKETGGVLLGIEADQFILVTVAGDRGPNAHRTRTRFTRDLAHATALADSAYEDTGAVWVGEWHTHPESGPIPSTLDITSYAALLDDDELHLQHVVAFILTADSNRSWSQPDLAAWLIDRTDQTIRVHSPALAVDCQSPSLQQRNTP